MSETPPYTMILCPFCEFPFNWQIKKPADKEEYQCPCCGQLINCYEIYLKRFKKNE